MASDRRSERLIVSAAAVLTVQHATELLPMAEDAARGWLARNGLVRDLDGRDVVVWGDVVSTLSRPKPDAPARSPRGRLPRVDLTSR